MRYKVFFCCLAITVALVSAASCVTLYSMWDLEAVDENGLGAHPLVGAVPVPENRVAVQGIALNSTDEILPLYGEGAMYTLFLQDESGGLQVWAGSWWYGDEWLPPEYALVEAGDLVRVEGFLADHLGKVFINDRHSSAPELRFIVTIIQKGVGMPEPKVITSVSACNSFDQTRAGGGEKYQTQWCRLNNVEIVSGAWGNDEELAVSDGTGELTVKLSSEGDFDDHPAPTGKFDVIGVFDQEDPELPYHDHYRIWVKKYKYIIPSIAIRKAIKVEWPSAVGVTYQVYGSDDAINWQPLGAPLLGNGTSMFIFDDVEEAWKKFYKIEIR